MNTKEHIFETCKKLNKFTTKDITTRYNTIPEYIVRKFIAELKNENMIYMHGNKKGAYYTLSEVEEIESAEAPSSDNSDNKLSNLIYEFIKSNGDTTSNEVVLKFTEYKEYIIKREIQLLRDNNKIFMHGNKRGAYYNLNKEEIKIIETPGVDVESVIFKYFADNKKWITKKEVAESLKLDETLVKNTIRKFVDDYSLSMRGSYRWAEYCHADYEEELEDELIEGESDNYLNEKLKEYFKKNLVSTIPQLIEIFDVSRFEISKSLKILIDEEFIYKDGVKKSTKYILMDANYDDAINIFENKKQEVTTYNSEMERLLNNNKYIVFQYRNGNYELIEKSFIFNAKYKYIQNFNSKKTLVTRLKEMYQ